MLKRVYEVENRGEILRISWDRTAGVSVEGYDIEAQYLADIMANIIGHGQLFRVMGIVALERGEESLIEIVEELKGALASQELKKGNISSYKSPVALAAGALGDKQFHNRFAAREQTHPVTLIALSKSQDARVRRSIATNYFCPPNLLTRFLRDREVSVRNGALSNPKIPQEILQEYSKSEDMLVRSVVANNSNIDSLSLSALCVDESFRVAKVAVLNPKRKEGDVLNFLSVHSINETMYDKIHLFPLSAQLILFKEYSQSFQSSVIKTLANNSKHLKIQKLLFKTEDLWVLGFLAHNHYLVKEIQMALLNLGLREGKIEILTALARNTHLDAPIYKALADSQHSNVLQSLGFNSQIGPEIIDILIDSPIESVQMEVAQHGNLSLSQALQLCNNGKIMEIVFRNRKLYGNKEMRESLEMAIFDAYPDFRVYLAGITSNPKLINKLARLDNFEVDKKLEKWGHDPSKIRKRRERGTKQTEVGL